MSRAGRWARSGGALKSINPTPTRQSSSIASAIGGPSAFSTRATGNEVSGSAMRRLSSSSSSVSKRPTTMQCAELGVLATMTSTSRRIVSLTVPPRQCATATVPILREETNPVFTDPQQQAENVKNASLLFESVWTNLAHRFGEVNMIFPKEIIWLMGAPGSGKGTNTPFILQARGITAEPVVLSSLLDAPEYQKFKAEGAMISDSQVVEILLENLLQEKYHIGALVDGFPRTETQVEFVRILYERMLALKRQHPQKFPRPVFRMAVLFVEEKTSIERQLARGRRTALHNEKVLRTSLGELLPERPTDMSEKAAAKRYAIFKQHFATLTTLQKSFPFHLINAQDTIEQVRARILKQFEYQSSLELDEHTFDIIEKIPLASAVTLHARQNLVKRLDDYQSYGGALFGTVISIIKEEFLPDIQQHAIAGDVLVRCDNPIFDNQLAVNMALDVLSERGYHVSFDSKVERIPERVDSKTYQIISSYSKRFYFHIRFPQAVIRSEPSASTPVEIITS